MRVAVSILVACALGGCGDARPDPKFPLGSFVESVVSGHRGQVASALCFRGASQCDYYTVRFNFPEAVTDVRLIGGDGAVQHHPIALIEGMRPFELRAAQ